jgi:hypothetical protein
VYVDNNCAVNGKKTLCIETGPMRGPERQGPPPPSKAANHIKEIKIHETK